MRIVELLNEIRPTWIDRIAHQLARGESVRESFRNQLSRFYELMQQAIVTGDSAWLNAVLDEWATSRTQSDLEQREASLTPILNQILLSTYKIAHEDLEVDDGFLLLGAVLPLYIHAFQYVTRQETQLHIEHISVELEISRITLKNLDRNKSDFISVAAHELKTPLTLIEGYATMLRERFPRDDQESSGVLYLKGIDNGIRRLREIVNDMIDVSMIDNDMLELNFQPVWINQLLSIINGELENIIVERGQILKIVNFPGSAEMTFGDPERLYQALRNILTNAIKYTPDGGSITIDGRKLPGFIEITIADTGIGIDEEYHERIFVKFGSIGNIALHSSGKTKFMGGGPGLGLPITKGVIEAHGGAIWVESPGCDEDNYPGSTFHVLLPIRTESPDEKIAGRFQQWQVIESENELAAEP